MKILLTAFEPFGGETVNPAQEAAALVPNEIEGIRIVKMDVPVVFGKSIEAVRAVMEREQPRAVLCLGQAGGRTAITPERVAVNLRDARIPDNAGNQPRDEAVEPQGPAAYFSTLPVRQMTEAIRSAGIPAALSLSAGAFVCNDLFYLLMHSLAGSGVPGGFIHVPAAKDLPPDQTARGLALAILAINPQN